MLKLAEYTYAVTWKSKNGKPRIEKFVLKRTAESYKKLLKLAHDIDASMRPL